MDQALSDGGFEKEDIDKVLLVGGSSKMPKVKEWLIEYFGDEDKICESYNGSEVNKDLAVAIGATLMARELSKDSDN